LVGELGRTDRLTTTSSAPIVCGGQNDRTGSRHRPPAPATVGAAPYSHSLRL